MDYAQLRTLLEPLITGLKDAGTHTVLPMLCEELGLPAPVADGSRRERMASSFNATTDTDQPAVARKLLVRQALAVHAPQGQLAPQLPTTIPAVRCIL